MADVIAAIEVVRREIRLEVAHQGPADVLLEQRLVAVQKARARTVGGGHHFVHGAGRQHVVMVGQAQVSARGQAGGAGLPAFFLHTMYLPFLLDL